MKEKIIAYVSKMNIYEVNDFAIRNGIYLSRNELEFTYKYLKENINTLVETRSLDIESYQNKFSSTNYMKIRNLINEYLQKYKMFL